MEKYKVNSISGTLKLPFEFFVIDEIKNRLKKLKSKDNLIRNYYQLDFATNGKIRKKDYEENARFFAYIKFFVLGDMKYGLVGGKTNYTSPDLDFSMDYGTSLTSFAKKFLSGKEDIKWDDTIIIIEHIAAEDKKSDEEMALFIECFLQREFNLFDS